jgi:hypothetical protein
LLLKATPKIVHVGKRSERRHVVPLTEVGNDVGYRGKARVIAVRGVTVFAGLTMTTDAVPVDVAFSRGETAGGER